MKTSELLYFSYHFLFVYVCKYFQAALHHARLGDFSKYCAMMVDLGEWTAALALAPW